ncbi:hypothetical protein EH30_08490 [Erythrobacter sp. JL475]|nr:hypothetical protein EH30_08490 [Erythrobacter sp. JL475]
MPDRKFLTFFGQHRFKFLTNFPNIQANITPMIAWKSDKIGNLRLVNFTLIIFGFDHQIATRSKVRLAPLI